MSFQFIIKVEHRVQYNKKIAQIMLQSQISKPYL